MALSLCIPEFSSDEDDYSDDGIDLGLTARVSIGIQRRKGKLPAASAKEKDKMQPKNGRESAVKKKPKMSFWQKKELAFQKFGEADVRPQDKYRDFLLHRRRLNNGNFNDMWTKNPEKDRINQAKFINLPCDVSVREIYQNEMIVVREENNFMKMMSYLNSLEHVSLDLEGNDDHSYLGMTVMIQIGTPKFDFIIDCFPLTRLIMEDLSQFLQNPEVIKYLYGGDNDILWLQRDFFIFLTSAIDVQLFMQHVLLTGKFDEITEKVPFQQKKQWYHQHIGPRRASTPKETLRLWEKNAGSERLSYEKFVQLFYPTLEIDKDAQVADFRPRENPSKQYETLLSYARGDVHLLLLIVETLRVQAPKATDILMSKAFDETKVKLRSTYKRKSYPSEDSFIITNAKDLKPDKSELAGIIYKWRSHHAKLIDEAPTSMFTDKHLIQLFNTAPATENEIDKVVVFQIGKVQKPPESIGTWRNCLYQLLTESTPYFQKIMSIQRHNCHKIGHAGWGCPEPWSTSSTKQNLRENPEAKNRQNHRRQVNKRKNKRLRKLGNTEDP